MRIFIFTRLSAGATMLFECLRNLKAIVDELALKAGLVRLLSTKNSQLL